MSPDKALSRRSDNPDFPTTPQGNNYLLAIGIDTYVHSPRLYNCVKDAQDLIDLLTERYRFDTQHIKTLFNHEATKDNIYRAFREMAQRVTPQDNLLLYFSGHGEYDKVFKEGYWIPVEAQLDYHYQYIPNSEIKTFLSGINSHHTFLMSDSCFAGALFAKGVNKSIEKRYEKDPSRWGLTAGRNEVVSDGKPGDNSPFAESLLYRLRQNTDALGVAELCAYVTEYVQAKTNQTPIGEPLKVEGHKNGQFVFHLKKDENRDWAAAKVENTVVAYERFLQSYPTGTHAEEARVLIVALQDDAAWQEAKAQHTIIAYENYLSLFPKGRYRRQAMDAQRDIEEAEAWQRATRRNAIPAYREFQDNYPNSKHYNEATECIQQLLARAAITTKEDTPIIIPKPEPKPVVIQPPLSKKPIHYKPYLFVIASFLLLVVVVAWIWYVTNNNTQVTDSKTKETTDSITNKQQVDTPKTTPNNPAISEEKEVETPTNTGRTTDPSKKETKSNTTLPKPDPKKEENTAKTAVKTEAEKEAQPPPTIDRARIKKLLTDAIQLLQFDETVEDAKKKLQEVLRLDEKNATAKDALLLLRADDKDGAIDRLKKAQ